MRVGSNPNRTQKAGQFTDVVLTCVTHLPNMDGYHAKRLEVIQTCLTSMRTADLTIAVWDNGSCDELRDWIQNEYKPDVFIHSQNIGKTQARLSLARMFSGRIMAYSDDDIFFYPNWLKPQLEILKTFPNVACVTGYPVRTSFRWGGDNTRAWGAKYGKMLVGKFIPQESERDFAVSIGRDISHHNHMTVSDMDYLVKWNNLSAYATSHHCQFVAYADTIVKASQSDIMAMGDEKPFDIAMDNLGLRLATTERLTRHIGNILDDKLKDEIKRLETA